MKSALSWFEIPVVDMPRATRFYSDLLQSELRQETFAGVEIAILPYQQGNGTGGALALADHMVPSKQGSIVYLDAGHDLEAALARVRTAGGTVLMGTTKLSDDVGSIAFFQDSEGNRVGLHSPPSPPAAAAPRHP